MMPVYEAECPACGWQGEVIVAINEEIECPECGFTCKRLISVPGVNVFNQDAAWLKSVTDVVDKEGGPACQEFLKNPTRDNYHAWMKSEGIRPFEQGESTKPRPVNMDRIMHDMLTRHRERHRIEAR